MTYTVAVLCSFLFASSTSQFEVIWMSYALQNFEHVYFIKYSQGWKLLSTASHLKKNIFRETGQIATEFPPP